MNEPMIPLPFMQSIMKNRLEIERMKAQQTFDEINSQVKVSELKEVKWFWEKTIATLIENGITTLEQFKWLEEEKALTFLTPVQFHQINLYIKNNNI